MDTLNNSGNSKTYGYKLCPKVIREMQTVLKYYLTPLKMDTAMKSVGEDVEWEKPLFTAAGSAN